MSIPAAASGTILRSLTEYTHGRGTGYGALHPTHSGFEGMRRFSDWDAAHVGYFLGYACSNYFDASSQQHRQPQTTDHRTGHPRRAHRLHRETLMGLLDHKTAVVTGANSGIGLATAERFIAEGAERVFITGRRQRELDSAAAHLGSRAVAVPGDVGRPEDLDRLYHEVGTAGAGLDVIVANAGSTRVARLGEITDDDLDALLATNIKGVVYTVQKALPLLNDGASIILIGSTTADRGRAGLSIYAASKAAVRSLARTWANELADRGIRVNVVVAGSTVTPGSDNLAAQADPDTSIDDFRAARITTIPLARFADPVEIANAAVFLASDLSSFTTGSTVTADGGFNQV